MIVWSLGEKIIRTVLCCVRQLCTMIRTHTCEQFLNLRVDLGLDFVFVCLFMLNIYIYFLLVCMHTVSGLLALMLLNK